MFTTSTLEDALRGPVATLTDFDPTLVKERLRERGAVLVRARVGPEDFEALSDSLMTPVVHHSTSTTIERDAVSADATTSTVNKGMDYIPLHREASYAPGCPDLLMLYCVKPPDADGETFMCDGVSLLDALPADVRDFVSGATLKWSWQVAPERWRAFLGVQTKEEAAARLKLLSARFAPWEALEAEFDGDTLNGVYQTLCVVPTRWGGLRAFCNSLLIYHYRETSAYYPKTLYTPSLGDGSPFPADVLAQIAERAEAQTRDVQWEAGDILLIDNSRYMHGRRAFTDPHRRILFRMGHVRRDAI